MLKGLKVVELATYIAGPGAGGLLADWGAEVVKIETRHGDPMRYYAGLGMDGTINPAFALDNRGKRSIVLDIAAERDRAVLDRLLGEADIFISNVRPASLKRAGLDWVTLHAARPSLIYGMITGYGMDGPDADKPGFDIAAYWARSGLCAAMTPKGTPPLGLRSGVGDHMCGLSLVAGVLAAVIERGRTGEGSFVETSLLRNGVYAIGSEMAVQLKLGRLASMKTRDNVTNPLNNFFQAGDGKWVCLIPRQGGDGDWPAVARAAGLDHLADDDRYNRLRKRMDRTSEVIALLDEAFAKMDFETLSAALDRENVVWGPLLSVAEAAADEQARVAGCFTTPDEGGVRNASTPVNFNGDVPVAAAPPPTLNQHRETILSELGFAVDWLDAARGEANERA